MEHYALELKAKKRPKQIYLYCPKAYSRLLIDIELNKDEEDDSDKENLCISCPTISQLSNPIIANSSTPTMVSTSASTIQTCFQTITSNGHQFQLMDANFPNLQFQHMLNQTVTPSTPVQSFQPALSSTETNIGSVSPALAGNSASSSVIEIPTFSPMNEPTSPFNFDLNNLSRQRQLPIRFRHSIGSPSLSVAPQSVEYVMFYSIESLSLVS